MTKLKTTKVEKEKAILVGVATRAVSVKVAREHMAELGRLADTAGAVVVETTMQRRETMDPSTLVGEGKVAEIADMVARHRLTATIVCARANLLDASRPFAMAILKSPTSHTRVNHYVFLPDG